MLEEIARAGMPVDEIIVRHNTRTTFDPEAMAELVASVKAHGVLVPLIVREGPEKEKILVAGERRLRAAREAGLSMVPVIVHAISEDEATEIQAIENLQREDLHPMDEAEAYQQLLEVRGSKRPGDGIRVTKSVADLAARVGKSTAYVYRRLRLLSLPAQARKAFKEDTIDARTALLFARIPNSTMRTKAAKEILRRAPRGGFDYEDLAAEIQRSYMCDLKSPPFNTSERGLIPKAGACTDCPKRSGNDQDLFGDLGDETCTDSVCYGKKAEAHWAKLKQEAKASGRKVIEGKAAEKEFPHSDDLVWNSPLVDLKSRCDDDPKRRTWQRLLGKDAAELVTVARAPGGSIHQVLDKKDAARLAKQRGHDFKVTPAGRTRVSNEEKRQRAEMKLRRGVADDAIAQLCGVDTEKLRAVDFWGAFTRVVCESTLHDVAKEIVRARELPRPAKDDPRALEWAKRQEEDISWEGADPRSPRGMLEALAEKYEADGDVEGLVALATEVLARRFVVRSYYDGQDVSARYGPALRRLCLAFGVDLEGIHQEAVKRAAAEAKKKPARKKAAKKKATKRTTKKRRGSKAPADPGKGAR